MTAKLSINLDDPEKNALVVGQILKFSREALGLSLRDMKTPLGYRYANFISMVENGHSKIPLVRISDFCRAYGLEGDFAAVIVKYQYEDIWMVLKNTISGAEGLFCQDIEKIDEKVEELLKTHIMACRLQDVLK